MAPQNQQTKVDMAAVAQHAGVSASTVSRYINKSATVLPDTATRIQRAIDELGYVPNTAAQALAGKHTMVVGAIVPSLSRHHVGPLLEGIEAVTKEADYNLLISARSNPQGGHPQVGDQNTDGLLVFSNFSLSEAEAQRYQTMGFPVVMLHATTPAGTQFPSVNVENRQSSLNLVSHLIENCGRRRIAFLRGRRGSYDTYWRETGYREALEAHDLPYDTQLVGWGNYTADQAQITVEEWLSQGVEIDAIFAGNDYSAIGAVDALRNAGIDVPHDVSVVGFDDTPLARHVAPALTTVNVDFPQVGYEAASRLLQLINGEHPESVVLPTELVIRESCCS